MECNNKSCNMKQQYGNFQATLLIFLTPKKLNFAIDLINNV